MNYHGSRPVGWTTKTFWVHLAKNIATDRRITRRAEFTRHDVQARALQKTQDEGLSVANVAVAASYAFHYLVKTGYLTQQNRGAFCPTAKLRSANADDLMWDCFSAHRRYANERASQNGNARGISRAISGIEKHTGTLRGLVVSRHAAPRKSKAHRLVEKLEYAITALKAELEIA